MRDYFLVTHPIQVSTTTIISNMSSDTPHAFRMPPRASSFRTNSVPSVPPGPPATTSTTSTTAPVRNYSDKFKKQLAPVPAAAAPPVSISSFTEFPSLRKAATPVATPSVNQVIETTVATAATVATVSSWAKTAKVAHEKDLARLEKERLAEVERLAHEEKERIRNTISRIGAPSRDYDRSEQKQEDRWTDDEEDTYNNDEEGMGYVANKYTEGGYVANKYADSGTPPYSPFDQDEVEQGIVEND